MRDRPLEQELAADEALVARAARRLAYIIDLPPVRAPTGGFLPRRTVTATYGFSD